MSLPPPAPLDKVPADARTAPVALEKRLRQVMAELITTKLWISTIALAILALLLTLYPFIAKRPGVGDLDVFLASQLGAGLLVSSVGAALLQVFVVRIRRRYDSELGDLDNADREGQTRSTAESLSIVSQMLTDLHEKVHQHDLRTDHTLISSLNKIGIANMYFDLGHAAPALVEALNHPSTTEVRLLGVSLDDFVRPGEHADLYRAWRVVEDQVKRGRPTHPHDMLVVKVLLLDPNSMGAQLLCHDLTLTGRREQMSRLRNDIDYVSRRLTQLTQLEPDSQTRVTLELRFYRVLPQLFLCATDQSAFSHAYIVPRIGESAPAGPVFQLESGSALYNGMLAHFDLIWQSAAVPAQAARRDFADGTDRGIHQSGICNIYTDSSRARERIVRLMETAQRRIWIQGISLYPMLLSSVTRAIEDAIQRDGVEIRLLILDPDCGQAVTKSFQEHVSTSRHSDVVESWRQYREDPAIHRRSQLYNMIRESIRRAMEIGAHADPARYQVRLYDSAPGSYLLLVDDRVLVEQYHYGEESRRHRSPLELAEEMPLVEYEMTPSDLFRNDAKARPFSVLENHFNFIFSQLSIPVEALSD